ncbi:MAG: 23S rRNA (adenine(2503)-C(2))-methyltransferase RlmN [Treponema sp.]|jgi:23S rRNA (adenine2503-C2)-methyltransferase|nr:23S rRNA (adenine(2503)-C(2))-methyltransferase RlmN [Treponema sp.]
MENIHGNNGSIIDIINDPFGFTFSEINGVIGEHDSKALYALLYKNSSRKKNHAIRTKDIIEGADTKKYIFELSDGKCIETVCIKRKTGVTACVSAQVGCPVRCVFCESGGNGLIRNLTASEIVQQIVFLEEPINRIVFMGIGEPLYNYDALIKSIHILRDRNGMDFPTDGITISTVGPIKFLKRLREEHIKIQLVLSLHATNQKARNYIIPGMTGDDINETVRSALSYSRRHNRKLTIAYLLSPGINDKYADVKQLVEWFRHENVMINLLEYNKTNRRGFKNASGKDIERFKNNLEHHGIEVKTRVSRGRNIKAACGQLASKYNE